MGEHKYNPNVQLAKEGKLPPREPRMSKAETNAWLRKKAIEYMRMKGLPIAHEISGL